MENRFPAFLASRFAYSLTHCHISLTSTSADISPLQVLCPNVSSGDVTKSYKLCAVASGLIQLTSSSQMVTVYSLDLLPVLIKDILLVEAPFLLNKRHYFIREIISTFVFMRDKILIEELMKIFSLNSFFLTFLL